MAQRLASVALALSQSFQNLARLLASGDEGVLLLLFLASLAFTTFLFWVLIKVFNTGSLSGLQERVETLELRLKEKDDPIADLRKAIESMRETIAELRNATESLREATACLHQHNGTAT